MTSVDDASRSREFARGKQDVVDTAVLEFVHDSQPEPFGCAQVRLRPLGLLDPQA